MNPVARPFLRPASRLRGGCRLQFIRGHAAVAVPVEAQDEYARLFNEFLARDLAVLVLVEITEIGISETWIGFLDRLEFRRAQAAVTVAIAGDEQLLHE